MSDNFDQPLIVGPADFTPEERYDTVKQVYDEVSREFYAWEENECQTIISSLSRDLDFETPPKWRPVVPNRGFEASLDRILDDDSFGEVISVFDYDDDGDETRMTFELVQVEASILPTQRYFFCTPSSRSTWGAGKFSDSVPFIPHADDPKFPISEYLGARETAWSAEFRDPDKEVLEVEVVRRLVAQGFTDKMIDETKLLGNELRYSHNWGLLWEYSQRDALHWPATFSNLPHLDYFNPSAMTENEALDVGLSRFCPSLNCAHQCCGIHNNELGPPTNKAYKDSTSIWVTVGTKGPCGSDCIHYRERPDLEDITSDQLQDWDENDIEFLRYNLQMEPDASPCNLAVICEKPCWEIFVYRKELIPDEDIEDPFTIEEGPTRLPANFNDGVTNDGVFDIRVDPCSHKGPCGRDSSCPCFLEGQFCQRSCRCSDKCTLRFAGCSCSDHCARATCKCRKYSRECDPLLCRRCDAGGEREYNLRSNRTRKRSRNNGPLRFCQNTGIQRQDFPVIEIMPAKYGFGAFTTTSIPEGTCIGEYTGEIHRFSGDILSQALSTSREVLNNFRELNYMFSLEKTKHEEVLVDAAAVGNETRYLNHNDEKRSNCEARHCLVNGERRISFITTKKIAARKELFINYGELYWGMG